MRRYASHDGLSFDDVTARRRDDVLTLYGLTTDVRPAGRDDEIADIVDLARTVTGADTAQLNLLGSEDQATLSESADRPADWRIPRSSSVCSAVIEAFGVRDVIAIADTLVEPALHGHPLVVGPHPTVRSYAGAPLVSQHGWPLGMLCVWSAEPRELDDVQRRLLHQLGRAAMHVLEGRRRGSVHPSC